MNLALFAADEVGCRIAAVLAEQSQSLACLVLDRHDRNGYNDAILSAFPIKSTKIIYTEKKQDIDLAHQLAEFDLDLAILAWWPYLIGKEVIRAPRLGCLNCHPSYLPYGRGKAPNFWAIVEGTRFGVTIHFVEEGIDSGPIAFQREIPVNWLDTGETLHRKARDEMVHLFADVFPQIRCGEIPRIDQSQATATFHRQRELEPASRIELNRSYTGRELLNLIRARTFAPYPGAWFEDDGEHYELRISISKRDAGEI